MEYSSKSNFAHVEDSLAIAKEFTCTGLSLVSREERGSKGREGNREGERERERGREREKGRERGREGETGREGKLSGIGNSSRTV